MKKGMLFAVVLFSTLFCRAQTADNKSSEAIITNFFKIYEKKGLNPALDTVFSYGDEQVAGALHYIKDTLAGTIKTTGGTFYGYELITQRCITPSYCFYSYLVKYPKRPLRFNFLFYKPHDKWVMTDFFFDSNIAAEIMGLEKLQYVK